MAMSQQEKTDYKRKFNEDSYDRIGLYLPKGKEGEPGMKDIWQAVADGENMKLGEFIKKCVNEKINEKMLDKQSNVRYNTIKQGP